ncbi:MAG TPA: hypothetical protein VFV09_08015, partial [Actinomycetota bacterium]|nr:hypothetical protein [Actinomycetota bacterium]
MQREGSRLDLSARLVMTTLYQRLGEAGLWSHIRSVGGSWTRGIGGASFTTHDNEAFLRDLVASGRFCRDTPAGGLLHQGAASFREAVGGGGLHLSLSADNRITVHIYDHSPVAGVRSDGGCRYERTKTLEHLRHEVIPLITGSHRKRRAEAEDPNEAYLLKEVEMAEAELRRALAEPEKYDAAGAAIKLASLLWETGDVEGARGFYEVAADSGHFDYAAAGSFSLGTLLERQEDWEGAMEAY